MPFKLFNRKSAEPAMEHEPTAAPTAAGAGAMFGGMPPTSYPQQPANATPSPSSMGGMMGVPPTMMNNDGRPMMNMNASSMTPYMSPAAATMTGNPYFGMNRGSAMSGRAMTGGMTMMPSPRPGMTFAGATPCPAGFVGQPFQSKPIGEAMVRELVDFDLVW